MDELQTIQNLKAKVKEEIRKAQERFGALDTVERMILETKQSGNVFQLTPRLYKGKKQDDAISDLLRKANRKLTAAEIVENLRKGGFQFRSERPLNSVSTTLRTNRKNLYVSEKIGGKRYFGLAERGSSEDQADNIA